MADLLSEANSAFAEVDERGYGEQFTHNGETYFGTWSPPDVATQMMTGNYQGRAHMQIGAHISQFAEVPNQRGGVVVRLKDKTQWEVQQIKPTTTHYVYDVIRVLAT